MPDSKLRKGQRVHVEYDAVVTSDELPKGASRGVWVDAEHESDFTSSHYVHFDQVTVIEPQDWPPQVGDIWELDGREYFVRENLGSVHRGEPVLETFNGPSHSIYRHDGPQYDSFRHRHPTLIRRRGQ